MPAVLRLHPPVRQAVVSTRRRSDPSRLLSVQNYLFGVWSVGHSGDQVAAPNGGYSQVTGMIAGHGA